ERKLVQAEHFASSALAPRSRPPDRIPLNLSWTGLAMRVARYFPMVVVTGLFFQVAVPFAARASDSAAIDANDQSLEPPMKGRYVDPGLQQAGYYDSRPRQNQTVISQPGSGPQKRALFSEETLTLPKSWFGRQAQP